MKTLRTLRPVRTLERILAALERELLEATDEEILEAAKELGMNPSMKGSAAFIGIKHGYAMRSIGVDGIRLLRPANERSEEPIAGRRRPPKDEPPAGP